MPEIALHHMDRHPVVEQLCRSCVAQPMSLAEPQRISRSICQSVQFVELGQRHMVAGVGAGTSPGQVLLDPDEQILRLQVRVGVGQPALLLADHVDHRLLHQDGRNHTVDLGLLVAQFGHERIRVIGLGGPLSTRDRLQRLVIEHQNL